MECPCPSFKEQMLDMIYHQSFSEPKKQSYCDNNKLNVNHTSIHRYIHAYIYTHTYNYLGYFKTNNKRKHFRRICLYIHIHYIIIHLQSNFHRSKFFSHCCSISCRQIIFILSLVVEPSFNGLRTRILHIIKEVLFTVCIWLLFFRSAFYIILKLDIIIYL